MFTCFACSVTPLVYPARSTNNISTPTTSATPSLGPCSSSPDFVLSALIQDVTVRYPFRLVFLTTKIGTRVQLPARKLGPLSPLLSYSRPRRAGLFNGFVPYLTVAAIQLFRQNLSRRSCRWIYLRQLSTFCAVLPSAQNIMNHTTPSPSPPPAHSSPAQGTPHNAAAGTKRKRSSGSKFYAVKVGFQPGVYYNWNDCLTQVTGYKGAVCESVASEYHYDLEDCALAYLGVLYWTISADCRILQSNHSLHSKKPMLSSQVPDCLVLRPQRLRGLTTHDSTASKEAINPVSIRIGLKPRSRYGDLYGRNTRSFLRGQRQRNLSGAHRNSLQRQLASHESLK